MSLQLYTSYLNKHIVTLHINISLRLYWSDLIGTSGGGRGGGGGQKGVERCGVSKLYPPLPNKIIAYENCTPFPPPLPPPTPAIKSLVPSLGIDFISYIKMSVVSSVAWDLKVHAVKQLVRRSGACSTRKFLNLGYRKCHLLRFLQDIFSK